MDEKSPCDINEKSTSNTVFAEVPVPSNFINKKVSYLTVSDLAKEKIREMLTKRGKVSSGIKVSIRTKGCSGLAYKIEFADYNVNFTDKDEMVEIDEIRIFIDIKASLFIIGTEMHYEIEKFKEGFVFQNPNEKGKCGCGSSFYV